jgi:hypothetical protein
VFVSDLGSNALSLSGSVPSESARKEVRDLSRQLFRRPGLDDRLELASGAPKNWDEAVAAALRALSQLVSGKIVLSGLAVTIEGVAPDKGTAVAVSYQLRRDLPALFSTSESISWKEAAASQDIAARVIPRIKEMSPAESKLPKGNLPDLLPLLGRLERRGATCGAGLLDINRWLRRGADGLDGLRLFQHGACLLGHFMVRRLGCRSTIASAYRRSTRRSSRLATRRPEPGRAR